MPWQAAPEDWAAHPIDSVDLAVHIHPPQGMPDVAFHFTDGSKDGVPEHTDPWNPVSNAHARVARRAYRSVRTTIEQRLFDVA